MIHKRPIGVTALLLNIIQVKHSLFIKEKEKAAAPREAKHIVTPRKVPGAHTRLKALEFLGCHFRTCRALAALKQCKMKLPWEARSGHWMPCSTAS